MRLVNGKRDEKWIVVACLVFILVAIVVCAMAGIENSTAILTTLIKEVFRFLIILCK